MFRNSKTSALNEEPVLNTMSLNIETIAFEANATSE